MNIEIRKVEKEELKIDLFSQYQNHMNTSFISSSPYCQPLGEDVIRHRLDDTDERYDRFFAFANNKIVGDIELYSEKPENMTKANKGLGFLNGFVQQGFRGQGVASRLALESLSLAKSLEIRHVRAGTWEQSGEDFCQKLRGELVSRTKDMLLDLQDCNQDAIDSYLRLLEGKDWRVEHHESITDQLIDDIVELSYQTKCEFKVMYNQDWTSVFEDERKKWKQSQEWFSKSGTNYYCILIKDSNGKAIGYTEGSIKKNDPAIFTQHVTAVEKSMRRQGLGKLLKALMIDWSRKDMLLAKKMVTGNNVVNVPILRLNEKLGFKCTKILCAFRIDVGKALEILTLKAGKHGNTNNIQG